MRSIAFEAQGAVESETGKGEGRNKRTLHDAQALSARGKGGEQSTGVYGFFALPLGPLGPRGASRLVTNAPRAARRALDDLSHARPRDGRPRAARRRAPRRPERVRAPDGAALSPRHSSRGTSCEIGPSDRSAAGAIGGCAPRRASLRQRCPPESANVRPALALAPARPSPSQPCLPLRARALERRPRDGARIVFAHRYVCVVIARVGWCAGFVGRPLGRPVGVPRRGSRCRPPAAGAPRRCPSRGSSARLVPSVRFGLSLPFGAFVVVRPRLAWVPARLWRKLVVAGRRLRVPRVPVLSRRAPFARAECVCASRGNLAAAWLGRCAGGGWEWLGKFPRRGCARWQEEVRQGRCGGRDRGRLCRAPHGRGAGAGAARQRGGPAMAPNGLPRRWRRRWRWRWRRRRRSCIVVVIVGFGSGGDGKSGARRRQRRGNAGTRRGCGRWGCWRGAGGPPRGRWRRRGGDAEARGREGVGRLR